MYQRFRQQRIQIRKFIEIEEESQFKSIVSGIAQRVSAVDRKHKSYVCHKNGYFYWQHALADSFFNIFLGPLSTVLSYITHNHSYSYHNNSCIYLFSSTNIRCFCNDRRTCLFLTLPDEN